MERAIRHEPRHTMWDLTLLQDDEPTFQLIRDDVAYEALGGPLDMALWSDVADVEDLDVAELGSGQEKFWDWYRRHTTALGCQQPFFENPVAKAFYRWAAAQGGQDHWFERARRPGKHAPRHASE